MKKHPSHMVMMLSILGILIYFNIQFIKDIDKTFLQQKYNWKKVKKIDSIDNIRAIYATRNRLKIIAQKSPALPSKNTYALKIENENFYFRYEYLVPSFDTITFFDVNWIKGRPKDLQKDFSLIKLDLPLIQNGKNTVVTLGDDNFCRQHDEVLRKELFMHKSIRFIGTRKDVLGFPMEAEMNWSSSNILNIAKNLPQSDYQILLFSWHKSKESLEDYLNNLSKIKQILLAKNSKKIFWITPPAKKNNAIDIQILKALKQLEDEKTVIINLYNNGFSDSLQNMNKLYTAETMKSIAKQISRQL